MKGHKIWFPRLPEIPIVDMGLPLDGFKRRIILLVPLRKVVPTTLQKMV